LKKFKALISFLLILVLFVVHSFAESPDKLPSQFISVYFSPKGGCTEAIVHELNNAKSSILVQAYSFTSAPIAKALVTAHGRGIEVKVLLDQRHLTEKYTNAPFLAKSGVPIRIDGAHASAHNKVMIIDGETLITGSFNFIKAAEEKNAENLLVIRDKVLAARYVGNWKLHEGHSESYQGKNH
jgi:phosphatidylserine/phosphatidylglycerophosphate/cardiolipin synthase-like enzyme